MFGSWKRFFSVVPVVPGQRRSRHNRRRQPLRTSRLETLEERRLMAIDWSMPARFGFADAAGLTMIDRDLDGRMDMHLDPAQIQLESGLEVELVAKDYPDDADFDWTITGENMTQPAMFFAGDGPNETVARVPGEGLYYVTLTVNHDGQRTSETEAVLVRDYLVVSIGDSIAAGEGNPEIPLTDEQKVLAMGAKATWADTVDDRFDPDDSDNDFEGSLANRSSKAYAAQAAIALEKLSNKFSVTFVSVASSGARVMGDPETPWEGVLGGGLLDQQIQYSENEHDTLPEGENRLPAQIDRVAELIGDRQIDALFLSVGANDVNFAKVVQGLIEAPLLNDLETIEANFLEELNRLNNGHFETVDSDGNTFESDAGKYGLLNEVITAKLHPTRVFFNETHDPIHDSFGRNIFGDPNHDENDVPLAAMEDIVPLFGADHEEAKWTAEVVLPNLLEEEKLAADTHGWVLIDGIDEAFFGHGYTAQDERWIVTATDSRETAGPYTDAAAAGALAAVTALANTGNPLVTIAAGLIASQAVVTIDMLNQGGILHPNGKGHNAMAELVGDAVADEGGLEIIRTGYEITASEQGIIVTAAPGTEDTDVVIRANPMPFPHEFLEIIVDGQVIGAWSAEEAPNVRLRQLGGSVHVESIPAEMNLVIEDLGIPGSSVTAGNLIPDIAIDVGLDGSVEGLLGTLYVEGDEAGITLDIDDSAEAIAREVRLDRSSLAGLAPNPIHFQADALADLIVRSGNADDVYRVPELPGGPEVWLYSNNGDDVFHLGVTYSLLPTDRGRFEPESWTDTAEKLHIFAGRGSDVVNVATLTAPVRSATYSALFVGSGLPVTPLPVPIEEPIVTLPPDPLVDPQPEPPLQPQPSLRNGTESLPLIDIHGGDGLDTVNIAPTDPLQPAGGMFLDYFLGVVQFDGEAHADTLNVFDGNNPHEDEMYWMSADTIRRDFSGRVEYERVESVLPETSDQHDLVNVTGIASGTSVAIKTNAGDDTAMVASGLLGTVAGPLTVDTGDGNEDEIILDDRRSTSGQTFTVDGPAITRAGVGVTALAENLTISAGSHADKFNVRATSSQVTINAGSGADTVNLGNVAGKGMDGIRHNVTIQGQEGVDAVHWLDQQSTAGHLLAVSGSTVRRMVNGLDAGTITHGAVESVKLNAGAGNDTLDYSGSNSGVRVNLKLGTASGFAGVSGVEGVLGSRYADLLVGDDKDNTLIGGDGHDMLIGGLGGDGLDGGAGNDLVIASSTKYDQGATALDALFARWRDQNGSLASYLLAVEALRTGVTAQGYGLNAESVYSHRYSDDGRTDKVYGRAGLDWIFAMIGGANADATDALEPGEVRN